MKTLAAILVEQNKPLELGEVEIQALNYGQVLVRIHYSGICGSQLGEIAGQKGPDRWLPHLLGHEATATVMQVGPGVKKVESGDAVVLHWRKGSGLEGPTPKYTWEGKTVNAGWVTTFQKLSVISENRLTKVSKDLDLESGVLYGCALTTGYGAIVRDARTLPGESVIVLGAGGVGLCAIEAARIAGAYPIVAVDLYPEKLAAAKRQGASHTVVSDGNLEQALREIVGPQGADVVIENTGVLDVMQVASAITSNDRGRTVLVGVPPHDARLPLDTMPLHFGKVITGSHGGDADPDRDIPRLVRLQQAGRLELTNMLSHRFRLEDVNDALDAMRRGEVVRCVLDMDD
ncbi:MAG: zinc-binding dehydrogenase [Planctomycetes bacterium]|nr:zinc-binding dehydrogenase [Planctomycetota bacterium]